MLKREELIRPLCILSGTLLLLLALGSFLDHSVSAFLFTETSPLFARLFSAFGELPAFLLFIIAGVTWFRRRGRSSRFLDWFSISGSIALIAAGTLLFYLALREDLPGLGAADGVLLSAALLVFGLSAGLALTRNASRADCFRLIFTVLFAGVIAMLAVNLLKYPWSRPRMRLLAADPLTAFVPWWKPQGLGGSLHSDDYKSFPSGHTAMAACSLLFTITPALHPRLEGTGRYWLMGSIVWTAVVALSRLTMGAHFLTDVAAAWLFVFAIYLLSVRIFWRDGRIFFKLYDWLT